ncbi:zinc finger protein 692 [Osmerus mordax]|uniref:zinc finger protein 692 n=1 Tax=Osmerus mordax TaxID=8014 RepID=UPI003510443B
MATDPSATSPRVEQRRQRRRELDARRSKCRVRLGSSQQSWGQLKDSLGFSLHSELARHLLDSYVSNVCSSCSGGAKENAVVTSNESLHALILLVHHHGQHCPFPPSPQPGPAEQGETPGPQDPAQERAPRRRRGRKRVKPGTVGTDSAPPRGSWDQETEPSPYVSEAELCLGYVCEKGHLLSWSPRQGGRGAGCGPDSGPGGDVTSPIPSAPSGPGRRRGRGLRAMAPNQGAGRGVRPRGRVHAGAVETQELVDQTTTDSSDGNLTGNEQQGEEEDPGSDSPGFEMSLDDWQENDCEKGDARQPERENDNCENENIPEAIAGNSPKRSMQTDDVTMTVCRKKRKAAPKAMLPCEFEGCGQIFSTVQYLNYHVKYKHLHQRSFLCPQPSCGKSFNFKKHLKEHEKLHSNQRDFICDRCGGAFRNNSQLLIHYRTHTGEKPLQCEVCGFACNQKASLNWHMRKHNIESSYQFPCQFCGRRFEKRYNLSTHHRRSHPEQVLDHANALANTTTPEEPPPNPGPSDKLVKSELTLP